MLTVADVLLMIQEDCSRSFHRSEGNPFRWGHRTGKKLGEGKIQ